jgi:hypothetical protein
MEKDCRAVAKQVAPVNTVNPRACYECGNPNHLRNACPRLNGTRGQVQNNQNHPLVIGGNNVNRGNNGNPARGRVFVMNAEEGRQDLNIVTGTFSLNDHYATVLFDSGADYSFVSTKFMPLLNIKPSRLGFSYEIEIASGQKVETNKIIRGCKLELEGYTFSIDLIPFGHGSFDVIVGMDWLSKHKAEIMCHEKMVRIPLPNGELLKVYGEQLEEKVKHFMSMNVDEKKLEDIQSFETSQRYFPMTYPDYPLCERSSFA